MKKTLLACLVSSLFTLSASAQSDSAITWYKNNPVELAVQIDQCSETQTDSLKCSNAFTAYKEIAVIASTGLIMASSAKNHVVDNAVNGFAFDSGWIADAYHGGANSPKSISISSENGVVTVALTDELDGINIYLIPMFHENSPLQIDSIPQGRIYWECRTDAPQDLLPFIPRECRGSYK